MRSVFFAALAVVLLPSLARAGTRDDVLQGVARCANISDDRTWLECFYGAAQPMRSRLGLPPAPESQTRLSQTAAPSPRSGGGFFGLLGQDRPVPPAQFGVKTPVPEGAVDHIAARITAFRFDPFGRFTATLSNGQVWRQLEGDTAKAHWAKPPESFAYNAVISIGAFSSYNLKVAGLPGVYKVQRLQ